MVETGRWGEHREGEMASVWQGRRGRQGGGSGIRHRPLFCSVLSRGSFSHPRITITGEYEGPIREEVGGSAPGPVLIFGIWVCESRTFVSC